MLENELKKTIKSTSKEEKHAQNKQKDYKTDRKTLGSPKHEIYRGIIGWKS